MKANSSSHKNMKIPYLNAYTKGTGVKQYLVSLTAASKHMQYYPDPKIMLKESKVPDGGWFGHSEEAVSEIVNFLSVKDFPRKLRKARWKEKRLNVDDL